MNVNIISFFRNYRQILTPAINFTITRYLEKINFTPRIAEKVSGYIPRDVPTIPEKKIILNMHHNCFYCPNICTNYDFDHVIPFHYIYQTELFNIVPACARCNSGKSDKLPSQELFDQVKERNKVLQSQEHLRKDYNDNWYQQLYDSCLIDYQRARPRHERLEKENKNGCRELSKSVC